MQEETGRTAPRALVIGADGLLGSHLVRKLLEKKYLVRIFKQASSNSPTLDGLDIEVVEGDLLDEGDTLERAMDGCRYVLHLAAITDLWADPDTVWKVNLEATRKVLDACLSAKVERLIFTGSASSFGFGDLENPGDETSPMSPIYSGVHYMESKHRAMDLVLEYVRDKGLDALVVAPTFMLGSLDWRPSSGELIRQFIKRGMKVTSPGGRNFAYAPDVAEAMVSATKKGLKGECYILGGHNLTYMDFFSKVGSAVGSKPPKYAIPPLLLRLIGWLGSVAAKITRKRVALDSTMARLAICGTYYSSDKAVRDLDLTPTPIEVGIDDTIRSLIGYGHIYSDIRDDFKDKVALVTGASRGVGFAIARDFVKRGAKVVITARGEKRLVDSRDKLVRLGGQVVAVAGDVGKWEDTEKMVAAAHEHFGPVDILVNNAGVSMRGRFDELSPDVCQQTIQTNLMGCVYASKAAIDDIKKTKGHIVFISSIAGLFGLPGASTYCASKTALTGLSESLRLELLDEGVHSGVVYLGFTEHDPEKRILAADGSLVPPDRPAHNSQAYAASLVIDMIRKRKRRIVMTPAGVVGWLAYRLSPGFVEWAIRKAQSSQIGIFKRFS